MQLRQAAQLARPPGRPIGGPIWGGETGTLIATVHDTVREFHRHGVRKLIVVNGHYENQWFLTEGIDQGCFRPDVDVDLVYRFIRDTTWVSVRWYQPGGPHPADQISAAFFDIFFDGMKAH